jgi:hypothetical protein
VAAQHHAMLAARLAQAGAGAQQVLHGGGHPRLPRQRLQAAAGIAAAPPEVVLKPGLRRNKRRSVSDSQLNIALRAAGATGNRRRRVQHSAELLEGPGSPPAQCLIEWAGA